MQIRTRILPQSNYRSVFFNGKTVRMPIDPKKPVTELQWPEFYDIALGDKCVTGGNGRKDRNSSCWFCYASAHAGGSHYKDILGKIDQFFGRMSTNDRPLQVAIGGSQEPLEHPQFWDAVRRFKELDIVPNYTTNGVLVNDKAIQKTLDLCGGVAVTLHKHLEAYWRKALGLLTAAKVRTNVHVIVSDKDSIDRLEQLYQEYADKVEYFVLLPWMSVGFAGGDNARSVDYDHLERWLDKIAHYGKIAFGSNSYEWLKTKPKFGCSLYQPESMSKYLVMDDRMLLRDNSFHNEPVKWVNGGWQPIGA